MCSGPRMTTAWLLGFVTLRWQWELACAWLTAVTMSVIQSFTSNVQLTHTLWAKSVSLSVVSFGLKTGPSLIYPQSGFIPRSESGPVNRRTITQHQMGVRSSLRTNGPWLTASFIVLNGVSVVPNDSSAAYINAVVSAKTAPCTAANVSISDTDRLYVNLSAWISGLKDGEEHALRGYV